MTKITCTPSLGGVTFAGLQSATRLAAFAGFLVPAAAQATVTISSDPTSNMSCTATVCKPQLPDAVLNVTQLTNMLAASNVKVTTSGGDGKQATDIEVDAALTWISTSVLTLQAKRALRIDQPVEVAGTGGLTLIFNNQDPANLSFGPSGNVTFWDPLSVLAFGNQPFTLVYDIATLASDIASGVNPHNLYALAKSYDASADGIYTTAPIPSFGNGVFEGLGNTINNLTINDSADRYAALFGNVGSHGTLRDIGLTNVSVTGTASSAYVGALVAFTGSPVYQSFSTGTVTGGSGATVGGLVGQAPGSPISNSYSSATVLADADVGDASAGGLAGAASTILNSHATGSVTVHLHEHDRFAWAGGLAAWGGDIETSYATGAVTQTAGDQCSPGSVGGLAGVSNNISTSFATGAVNAACSYAGGLVGSGGGGPATYAVMNSYSTGSVNATLGDPDFGGALAVGGLAGYLSQPTPYLTGKTSYSIGAVSSPDLPTGGFAGQVAAQDDFFDQCYWDTQTSGQQQAVGSGSFTGTIIGVSTHKLKTKLLPHFKSSVWAIDANINNGFPYLIDNPPPQ